MRYMLLIIVILLAAFIGSVFHAQKTRLVQAPTVTEELPIGNKIGNQAPQLELYDLEGELHQLTDERGKIVIVNFWATWCPPCRDEMPDLQRFYEDYAPDVAVLGVNITKAETGIQAVRSFTEQIGITFPVLLDEAGDAINAYRVASYPSTFVLDQEGVIREIFRGPVHYDQVQQTLLHIPYIFRSTTLNIR